MDVRSATITNTLVSIEPITDTARVGSKRILIVFLPGSNLSPRGSGCYWLLGLAVGDSVAVGGGVMFQVSIRIFRSSPTVNRTYFRHATAACVVIELSFADRQPD